MLTPAGRGEFFTITFYPLLIASLGLLGLNTSMARLVSGALVEGQYNRAAVQVSLATSGLSLVVGGVVVLVAVPFGTTESSQLGYWCLALIPINHMALMLQSIDYGCGNIRRYNIIRLVLNPVYLVGLLVAWSWSDHKLAGAVAAFITANAVTLLCRLIATEHFSRSVLTKQDLRALWSHASRFMLANVISLFQKQSDKLLVLYFLDVKVAGLYVVAYSTASIIGVANASIGSVLFSEVLREKNRRLGPRHFRMLAMCSLVTVAGGLVFVWLLPYLFGLVYGRDYIAAVIIAQALVPAFVLSSISQIVEILYLARGEYRVSIRSMSISMLIVIGVGPVLAHYWSVWGVVLSVVVSAVGSAAFLAASLVMTVRRQRAEP